jgi:hypothetical protein
MPRLFGCLNGPDDASLRFTAQVGIRHADLTRTTFAEGWFAAATHGGRHATWIDHDGNAWAVFGERMLAPEAPGTDGIRPYSLDSARRLTLSPHARGVVAVFDPTHRKLTLACDPLNYFPVYYWHKPGRFLFSSHLKTLSRVVNARVDPAGTMEFLRANWCLNGRTVFEGIHKLLPGQAIEFDVSIGTMTVSETSCLWSGVAADYRCPTDDEIWHLILDGVRANGTGDTVAGLMLSGGWDSRVVLAALVQVFADRVVTLSHGASGHLELNLARRLAGRLGARHLQVEFGPDSMGRPHDLDELLDTSDTILFPWWRFAGPRLLGAGADVAFTGLLGEVLGGHYTVLGRGRLRRAEEVFRRSVLGSTGQKLSPEAGLRRVLAADYRERKIPFIKMDAMSSFAAAAQAGIVRDVEEVVGRFLRRGIGDAGRMVEAYNTEYRALDHFCQQPVTLHAHLDVATPLGYRPLVEAILAVPMPRRIHNSLSRTLLRRFQPELLEVPLAASPFVPASAPILIQEGGRVVRRLVDIGSRQAYLRSAGRIGKMRRYGWMDFERDVRAGDFLEAWRDSLTWDGLDRVAIDKYVTSVRSHETPVRLARPVLKLAYLDRMFRADRN